MSARSYYKRFQRYEHGAFDAEGPMSALNTFALRSNVQHAIDIASQMRINWVASTSANESEIEANSPLDESSHPGTAYWGTSFPLTITDGRRAPSLGVRVATRGSGLTTGTVNVQVAPVDSGTPLWSHTYTIASNTAAWQTEQLATGLTWGRLQRTMAYYDPSVGAISVAPFSYCMCRLIVRLENTTMTSSSLFLCGVQLREFV